MEVRDPWEAVRAIPRRVRELLGEVNGDYVRLSLVEVVERKEEGKRK